MSGAGRALATGGVAAAGGVLGDPGVVSRDPITKTTAAAATPPMIHQYEVEGLADRRPRGLPHIWQNRAPGESAVWQAGHGTEPIGTPHSGQNLLAALLPQRGHAVISLDMVRMYPGHGARRNEPGLSPDALACR